MQIDVLNKQQEKVDTIDLPDDIFCAEVSEALLWEAVKAQRASRRRGTHQTKTRANVSGTGAKPFKQKGGGRARQGSLRSPNHVGGGTVFGPHPRDYSYRLPRSARRAALRSALSLRVKEQALVVLDGFDMTQPKTKEVAEFTTRLGSKSVLLVDRENDGLKLSSRNLTKTKYVLAGAINVYDILNHEKLVLTRAAVEAVVEKATKMSGKSLGLQTAESAQAG